LNAGHSQPYNSAITPETDNPPPPALLHRNPLRWLSIFGPGAVIASLTIGAGELIFSARAGALFEYRILWFFLLALALKWILAYTAARQMVLTGRHPFAAWHELPGPKGWLPLTFLLLGLMAFPVWVFFHASTLGTLAAALTSGAESLNGAAHFAWGALFLAAMALLALTGGYTALEKVQMAIVLLMLASVAAVLFVIRPDWIAILKGLLPQPIEYPYWFGQNLLNVQRSPWLEAITCFGILGGSSFDYLAYVSYLRDKRWGMAGISGDAMARPAGFDWRWLRAPLVDCTLSFVAVLIFTLIFVICGKILLGERQQVPSGNNLLTLQAAFVTPLSPMLKHVYFAGAFLAILGTLYGTIEVAPAILREFLRSRPASAFHWTEQKLRQAAIAWVAGWAMLLIVVMFSLQFWRGTRVNLIAILTPANLFTGVLGCGIVCLLAAWPDRRHTLLVSHLPDSLKTANLAAGLIFLGLGIWGYFEQTGWLAFGLLGGTLAVGWIAAIVLEARAAAKDENEDHG